MVKQSLLIEVIKESFELFKSAISLFINYVNPPHQLNNMKIIKIKVVETKDGFVAYSDNGEDINAVGNTLLEVKQAILNAIRLLKENNTSENIPKGDYQIVYV